MIRSLYVIIAVFLLTACATSQDLSEKQLTYRSHDPADSYYFARMYPDTIFPIEAYRAAMQEAVSDRNEALAGTRGGADEWTEEGPYNISGRFNTIAVHPDDNDIVLAGLASGGIFKTIDGGISWYPVFDEFSFLAIAHIAFNPSDPNIVYAATGDPNISGFPFIGDGIYKSSDAGETWTYTGLSEAGILSKIIVHPANPDILYVASMGLPFERTPDRGLYKSVDAGISWEQVLYVDDDCGVTDIVSDPGDTDVVYAAVWNRIRNNHESVVSGPDAGIYRSNNGGSTWTLLDNGLPGGSQSRISIEMNPDNPSVLYASVVGTDLSLEGIYKTTNAGNSWSALPLTGGVSGAMSGFGWYFDGIQLNSENPSQLFVQGVGLYRTTDDGSSWSSIGGSTHADKHAMAFYGASKYWLATDGGLYKTTSDASVWNDGEDINSAQFYHIDQNPFEPGIYWGGMQDNGTSKRSDLTGGLWEDIYGADGFHSEFRTDVEDVYYVEYQNGGIVGYDGGGFFDATDGISGSDRRNWNTPYMISRFNNDVVYAGTYRMYKSISGIYPNFLPISDDLTDGIVFSSSFHTLTTIEEDRFDPDVLYTGSVDANVYRTLNGGATWNNVSSGLPEQYVTDLVASYQTPNRIFVTHSGYKENEFLPHIHRSDDNGSSWTDISGDLPSLAINAVAVHPDSDDYLFVATDGGVYYSLDGGSDWERLGTNMPVIPIYDIEYDAENKKVLAGTHARGLWTFDATSIIAPILTGVSDTTICAGDTLVYTVDGASLYTWSSDEAEINCSGDCSTAEIIAGSSATIEVIGTNDYGLADTLVFLIEVISIPAVPEIYLYYVPADLSYGCLNIIDQDPMITYEWWLYTELISTEDTVCVDYWSPVILTAAYTEGCTVETIEFIDWPMDINDLLNQLTVEPNPISEVLSIYWEGLSGPVLLSIADNAGRKFMEIKMTNEQLLVDTGSWPAGIYHLYADGWKGSMQIVKQ